MPRTFVEANLFPPIGPYSHPETPGGQVFISATPGVDPATGQLAGPEHTVSQAASANRPGRKLVIGAVQLVQLSLDELRALAGSTPAGHFADALEGALPPPHVAARALAQVDAGMPAFWCVPFLIVASQTGTILGGCTFKGLPTNGDVEIAYGVAKPMRGRGVATAAIAQLLKLAAADGSARQVIAEILPANIGSSKVVMRLGFTERETFVDADGETVVRWILDLA